MDESHEVLPTKPSSVETRVPTFLNREGIIQEKLKLRFERDEDGFRRCIYHFNDKTFTFRGREELPIYPALKTSNTRLIGSEPVFTSTKDYQKYRLECQNQEETVNHFVVSKDITGVLSLALELGTNDPRIRESYQRLQKGEYDEFVLETIDQLIACNWIRESSDEWISPEQLGANAEAIVVMSLIGDEDARKFIVQQTERAERLEEKRGEKLLDSKRKEWLKIGYKLEPENCADPNKLVAIHATAYKPAELDDGSIGVQTYFDARDHQLLRNTVHVALNHRVHGHLGGQWKQSPYTILGNFQEMVAVNGKPISIDDYDTWWAMNPGERLKFPNGHLIEPGQPTQGLFEIRANRTFYKNADYATRDIKWLLDYVQENPNEKANGQLDLIGASVGKALEESLNNEQQAKLLGFLTGDEEKEMRLLDPEKILWPLSHGESKSLRETLLSIFEAAKLPTDDIEQIADETSRFISERLSIIVNQLAINETVRQKGYFLSDDIHDVQDSYRWAKEVGRVENLAVRIRVGTVNHFNSIYNSITNAHLIFKGDATKEDGSFDWMKFDPSWKVWGELDPKTRRVLYASGSFNARF